MRVLIVGCGYVGLPLGTALAQGGHAVFGLRRNRSAEVELRQAGIEPLFADITDDSALGRLPGGYDWVIHCAAAGGGGPEAYRRLYVEGTRCLLNWLGARPPRRLVYTSSTSVYGQNDGSWVAEDSATEPAAETGRVLLEAERLLLEAHRRSGFPSIVLRLAGIYGPERGYWLRQFLSGQARMDGDGSRFLNMIHRDDVVGAILAALERGRPGEIYNAVDDEPVAQRDLFRWLSESSGQPMPPALPEGELLRKRGVSHKRVSNRKLKTDLGYGLRWPSFREGFKTVTGP
jgi:nucleoside-diphosphate-sugar epimerase